MGLNSVKHKLTFTRFTTLWSSTDAYLHQLAHSMVIDINVPSHVGLLYVGQHKLTFTSNTTPWRPTNTYLHKLYYFMAAYKPSFTSWTSPWRPTETHHHELVYSMTADRKLPSQVGPLYGDRQKLICTSWTTIWRQTDPGILTFTGWTTPWWPADTSVTSTDSTVFARIWKT